MTPTPRVLLLQLALGDRALPALRARLVEARDRDRARVLRAAERERAVILVGEERALDAVRVRLALGDGPGVRAARHRRRSQLVDPLGRADFFLRQLGEVDVAGQENDA